MLDESEMDDGLVPCPEAFLVHCNYRGCLTHRAHVHHGLVLGADGRRVMQHQDFSLQVQIELFRKFISGQKKHLVTIILFCSIQKKNARLLLSRNAHSLIKEQSQCHEIYPS